MRRREDMVKSSINMYICWMCITLPMVFSFDFQKKKLTHVGIENDTKKEVMLTVKLATEQKKWRTNRMKVLPDTRIFVSCNVREFISDLQVFDVHASLVFDGYDARKKADIFRITAKQQERFPKFVDFEHELSKLYGYPFFVYHPYFTFRISEGLEEQIFAPDYLRFVKNIYKKNPFPMEPDNFPYDNARPLIPLIIHYIWFGSSLPVQYQDGIELCKKIHPEWSFYLWNEQTLAQAFPEGLVNQSLFDQAQKIKNYGMMSDIARYEILCKYGGLYVDCDIEILRSFNYLHYAYHFYSCMEPLEHGIYFGNAVIGSCREHPILRYVINLIQKYTIEVPHDKIAMISPCFPLEVARTLVMTGPKAFTSAILACACKDGKKDILFPSSFFQEPLGRTTIFSFCNHKFDSLWIEKMTVEKDLNEFFMKERYRNKN